VEQVRLRPSTLASSLFATLVRIAALISLLYATPAAALDWELFVSNRFYAESISEDILYAQLRVPTSSTALSERIAYQLHVVGSLKGRPADELGLILSLDTGLLEFGSQGISADGAGAGRRFKDTLFLGETGVDLQFGETGVVQILAGKIRPNIGAGAIFDAYAFGATLDIDPSLLAPNDPWRYRLHAIVPDATFTAQSKQSPLFAVELGYTFDRKTELRLFGAAFLDNQDGLTPVLADALFRGRLAGAADRAANADLGPIARRFVEERVRQITREAGALYNAGVIGYDLESSGYAAWLGLTGKAAIEEFTASAALIFGFGHVNTEISANDALRFYVENRFAAAAVQEQLLSETLSEVSLSSYFADFELRYAITEHYAVDAFGIFMSGDRGLSEDANANEDTYSSFIGLAPLLPFTSLFFNGGVASALASPVVASVAPDGAGLLGGGIGVELHPFDILWVRLAGAAMFATVASRASRSNAYGIEGDVELELQLLDFLAFSLQAAVFRPGAYFGELPVSYQLIAGVHAQLP
jgi:hypothetical protein